MESSLSLDELHISFPEQELKITEPRSEVQNEEEACDLLRENFSYGRWRCRETTTEQNQSSGKNEHFFEADYLVANPERETYAGKLPNICPGAPRKWLKNGIKKGRMREFSCIDVDDFTARGKPKAMIAKPRIEETHKRSVGTKQANLSSTAISQDNGCFEGQNLKYDPLIGSRETPEYSLSCNLELNLTRKTQTFPLEQNMLSTASSRNIFSPRKSFGSSTELKRRSKECSEKNLQELRLDLPEKFTKFVEMEISLIKGGQKVHSTQKRRDHAMPACIYQETELFIPKSMAPRKSRDSLLDKRYSREKTGCYNTRKMDSGLSQL